MGQPIHGTGVHGSTALAERPRNLECRNPACHLWAVEVAPRDQHDRCLFCGWQLAPIDAQDIALSTADGDWVVADPEEIIARGSEVRMRDFATSLTVRRLGHTRPGYAEPCVCHPDTPPVVFTADDLTPDGRCSYCEGTGFVTVEAANARQHRRVATETPR